MLKPRSHFAIGTGDFSLLALTTALLPQTLNTSPQIQESSFTLIQFKMVSKFASDLFEIEVVWVEREGHHYPIIVVPSGVRVQSLRNGICLMMETS